MKKFMSITLLTMLVLALCLPIIARYEVCPVCFNGRLEVTSESSRTVWCEICHDEVTETTIIESCSNDGCPGGEDYTYWDCGHYGK